MLGTFLGGIGFFLLGVGLLSDGLASIGGSTLRRVLGRVTKNPWLGVLVGSIATMSIQSSNATILMTIGFVRAGLLNFPQSLGLVYGANAGTSGTAWLVALFGLKIDMGLLALPLVGVGGLLRLFAKGKLALVAQVLAGFGLIFAGIGVIESAMADYGHVLIPSDVPGGPFVRHTVLVGAGALMTLIIQSSSAATVTTLAALHTGALTLGDAAALVIGQNIGKTFIAFLGAAGGSVTARRVARAHIFFNAGTGAVSLVLLPVFLWLIEGTVGSSDPVIALAFFHTSFSLLGIFLFVPAERWVTRFIERMVPEHRSELTARLPKSPTSHASIDIVAARSTASEIAQVLAAHLSQAFRVAGAPSPGYSLQDVDAALGATRAHLAAIHTDPGAGDNFARHISTLDALDHLGQLLVMTQNTDNIARLREIDPSGELIRLATQLFAEIEPLVTADLEFPPDEVSRLAAQIAELRKEHRARTLAATARGEIVPLLAENRMAVVRWLDRTTYHLWRAVHHLHDAREGLPRSLDPAID